MAKWWYYTIHKCPDCGRAWDEYDASAPWGDSGLVTSPTFVERCEECQAARREEDLREEEMVEAVQQEMEKLTFKAVRE